MRGPVGSLGAPEKPNDFDRFTGNELVIFVHRDVLSATTIPGSIRFNFGQFGWCRVRIDDGQQDEQR
jgi:hypothetical protein